MHGKHHKYKLLVKTSYLFSSVFKNHTKLTYFTHDIKHVKSDQKCCSLHKIHFSLSNVSVTTRRFLLFTVLRVLVLNTVFYLQNYWWAKNLPFLPLIFPLVQMASQQRKSPPLLPLRLLLLWRAVGQRERTVYPQDLDRRPEVTSVSSSDPVEHCWT